MRDRLAIRIEKARRLQPVLTVVAKRNREARELIAAMGMHCAACGATLAAHVGPGNRWKGCRVTGTGGAR